MGETVINNFMIGTIQNGSFVPIGKIDDVKTLEDENNITQEENVFHMHVTDDISFEFKCKFSRKSHRAIELMCLFGWRNKMPFRRRTLKKALRNKINSNLRWFVQ